MPEENGLDGKMLYLKTLRDGEWTKLDSAEVVHGSFSMKGKIDSVQMTTLYMDDERVIPVVFESGKIVITISNTDLKAVGTPLNTALYDFIAKKNAMEESIGELERKIIKTDHRRSDEQSCPSYVRSGSFERRKVKARKFLYFGESF